MKPISVAIDGPAGAGKSTVMEEVAKRLGLKTLDTGAMYRAAGLEMLDMGVDIEDISEIERACADINIEVKYMGGAQRTFVNGRDLTDRLRSDAASRASKLVSRVQAVRDILVRAQREIAEGESVIMNGRDIGTKVLPNAAVKIYLTASSEVRAQRRCLELEAKGEKPDYETILKDIIDRDKSDTERENSPLARADDAVVVDSSSLTQEQTIESVADIVRRKM